MKIHFFLMNVSLLEPLQKPIEFECVMSREECILTQNKTLTLARRRW